MSYSTVHFGAYCTISKSCFTEMVKHLNCIFTCTQIFIATGGNTVVMPALVSAVVIGVFTACKQSKRFPGT